MSHSRTFITLKSTALLTLCTAQTVVSFAQTDPTARERVLDYVVRTGPVATQPESPTLDIPLAPGAASPAVDMSASESISDAPIIKDMPIETVRAPDSEPVPEPELEPEPEIITEDVNSVETPDDEIISTATPIIVNDITDDANPEPAAEITSTREGPKSFGFFTSAGDYLAQRGNVDAPRLTMRYEVSRKNAKTAVPGKSSSVEIMVGPDYAAISKSFDELVIYDFKTKRLLNLTKSTGQFTNASLYAASYRAIDTVSKMTKGGEMRQLPLRKDITLNAFYLESALGYSAAPNVEGLSISQLDETITAELSGEKVFSASLNGPELDDYRQAYSFISLLYHNEAVHPAILAEIKDLRRAPNAMTLHSYGPKMPDGEIISWRLKSKMVERAAFPLPSSAKSVLEGSDVSPLGFVIYEALAGRAMGGAVDPQAAMTVINGQIDSGQYLSAWISAQSLKDRLGGCERLSGLCKAISTARDKGAGDSELTALVKALKDAETKRLRTTGLVALKPMINAPDAPSLVLRRAGLALAKTSVAERKAVDLSGLDPADLLRQAIARNPYDLLAYQCLAQVFAARGDFIQSWDMNDALRAFPDVPQRLRSPIDKAEQKLERRAPGFFPPVDG